MMHLVLNALLDRLSEYLQLTSQRNLQGDCCEDLTPLSMPKPPLPSGMALG